MTSRPASIVAPLAVIATVAIMASGCLFTRYPTSNERPRWELVTPASYSNDCVDAKAFVRKSGRQGFGMTIQLVSKRDCHVRITPSWHLADTSGADLALAPIDLDMKGRSLRYAWLPVAFDNLSAWNDGRDAGQLTLTVDGSAPWTMALRDVMHDKPDHGGP